MQDNEENKNELCDNSSNNNNYSTIDKNRCIFACYNTPWCRTIGTINTILQHKYHGSILDYCCVRGHAKYNSLNYPCHISNIKLEHPVIHAKWYEVNTYKGYNVCWDNIYDVIGDNTVNAFNCLKKPYVWLCNIDDTYYNIVFRCDKLDKFYIHQYNKLEYVHIESSIRRSTLY